MIDRLQFFGWNLPIDVAILCYVLMILGLAEIALGSYAKGIGFFEKPWKGTFVVVTGFVMICCSMYVGDVTVRYSIDNIKQETKSTEFNTNKETSYVTNDEAMMSDSLAAIDLQVEAAKSYKFDANNTVVTPGENIDRENIFKVDVMVNKTYKDLYTVANSSRIGMFDIHKDTEDLTFGQLRRYYVTIIHKAPSGTTMFDKKFKTEAITFFDNGVYGMATVMSEDSSRWSNLSRGCIVGYTCGAFNVNSRVHPYYVGVFIPEE